MKPQTLPPDVQPPSRYIEKVSLLTGEVLEDEITPRQLLVRHHRDFHIVDVYARYLMGQAVRWTGNPESVMAKVKAIRSLGKRAVDLAAYLLGTDRAVALGKKLLGFKAREYYFRYKTLGLERDEIERRTAAIRERARARFAAAHRAGRPRLVVLLTGGTGFLGQEIVAQAAGRPEIRELWVLVRPRTIRDRGAAPGRTVSVEERGRELEKLLGLDRHSGRAKLRFLEGDIERADLGIAPEVVRALGSRLTHVIHCAASVSFDDTYENSFRANVNGSLNALAFSDRMRRAPRSRFVAHVSIETSYIHGRQTRTTAREDEIVFPRNYFNNFYEVTKAMGSIETDRTMLERDLPVIQLCPSIVVGNSRTGNNRGDTKVVNAPVNAFGRVKAALDSTRRSSWAERSRVFLMARLATVFPGDPSAELNLIPVDRVVAGILASLVSPDAIGARIHLATDRRLRSSVMLAIAREEIEVGVHLAEPTLHRTLTLPVLERLLSVLDQPKLAGALKTLSTIFGGYSEWGQPVHEVGNDVEILGLPLPRPDTEQVFRMVCRHNRFVQLFGRIRDPLEIARRERIWARFIDALESRCGRPAGSMRPREFREALEAAIDLEPFTPRRKLSAG